MKSKLNFFNGTFYMGYFNVGHSITVYTKYWEEKHLNTSKSEKTYYI